MNTCSECKKEIVSGSFVGTIGGGIAHGACFYKANPPRIRHSFLDVITNGDDQVLVRELLMRHVSLQCKGDITTRFNEIIQDRHNEMIKEESNS